ILFVSRKLRPPYLLPFFRVKSWEKCIGLEGRLNFGKVYLVRIRECQLIYFSTSKDKYLFLFILFPDPKSILQRMNDDTAFCLVIFISCYNNACPAWQWPFLGFKGLPTHDDIDRKSTRLNSSHVK